MRFGRKIKLYCQTVNEVLEDSQNLTSFKKYTVKPSKHLPKSHRIFQNSINFDNFPNSIMSHKTDQIQNFLVSHLHYTPRRLLFEEFSEKLSKIRDQQSLDSKSTQFDQPNPSHDFKFLHQLNEFRMQNAQECMSEVNFRRTQRENEKLENFLKHSCVHRFRLNERLIPVPVRSNEHGQSLCIICGKAAEMGGYNAGNSMIINESKYDGDRSGRGKEYYMLEGIENEGGTGVKVRGYENSYALKYQKFRY